MGIMGQGLGLRDYLKDPKLWELWHIFLVMGNAGNISSTVTRTLSPKSLASNSRFESLGSCLGLLRLGFGV